MTVAVAPADILIHARTIAEICRAHGKADPEFIADTIGIITGYVVDEEEIAESPGKLLN